MAQLRQLPKVDVLANHSSLRPFSEAIRTRAARMAIQQMRESLLVGETVHLEQGPDLALACAQMWTRSSVRRVINGSGVVLHTGLGRARLSMAAAEAVYEAAKHHTVVEFDMESGERGDRQLHVKDHLLELTGAADALVVNNCAAAVYLALSALCSGRSVLLSRGQMVEIGGSFRMPDIIRESGCNLVEVGCTNKTHLSDYARADNGEVAAILRCHPSNFRMVGFVEEPPAEALAQLCREKGWLLIDDVGSGVLFDLAGVGVEQQPTLKESLGAGADLVLSSADKMLGGPQAGLMLGSVACIERVRKHPLARAMRVDKLTLAALEATLRGWLIHETHAIPTYHYLHRPLVDVKRDAQRIAKAYAGTSRVDRGLTEIGGGSAPGEGVESWRAGLVAESANDMARRLRLAHPPCLGRIEKGVFWLDPRTMSPDDVRDVVQILRNL